MKRANYVDQAGNPIDQNFESKKPILVIFFIIGTIVPLILIGFIIYTIVQNNNCNKIYAEIKSATKEYLKENDQIPTIEGENITISLDKLYKNNYLSSFKTNDMVCAGNVKTTRYKKDYVYTLNLTNCNQCTTNMRYGQWSNEVSYYPSSKPIVDVIPYYNYYERQIVVTDWSKYYEKEEISKKNSKYGIKLPKPNEKGVIEGMPEVPEEGNIVEAKQETKYQYRYSDKRWKWYDIVGNYSEYSSEQPSGFAERDDATKIYTNWSDYSLTYPEEKSYREISKVTGYQFYYEKDGKKVYANNKNYTAAEDVDQEKYNRREDKSVEMFKYRDSKWRWYNGEKRRYSSYYSEKPSGFNYRDDENVMETSFSSWDDESKVTDANAYYRTEESKILTRFRYLYEILSDPVLETPVNKDEFVSRVGVTVPEFVTLDEYKMEVSYKFKYRKR